MHGREVLQNAVLPSCGSCLMYTVSHYDSDEWFNCDQVVMVIRFLCLLNKIACVLLCLQ